MLYTVAMHNISTGILPLAEFGYSKLKPITFKNVDAARTVCAAHAKKHLVTCCVHDAVGNILYTSRPHPVFGVDSY